MSSCAVRRRARLVGVRRSPATASRDRRPPCSGRGRARSRRRRPDAHRVSPSPSDQRRCRGRRRSRRSAPRPGCAAPTAGRSVERSRNAPRARGPSSSPATASMLVDDDACIRAFQLWIVYAIRRFNAGHDHSDHRRHRQDRPAHRRPARRRRAPSGPPPAPPASTGTTARRGRRCSTASTPRTSPTTPTSRCPGAAETVGAFSQLAAAHGVKRLVLLSGRGEPEALRAEQAMRRRGHRVDRRALLAGSRRTSPRPSWSTACSRGEVAVPAGDDPGAVRGRRGHRRRRRRGADPGRPPRPGLRAHRAARAALRRGGGGDRRRVRPRRALHADPARRLRRRPRRRSLAELARRSCSPSRSTAATPSRRTASSARSAARRATSASTPARVAARGAGHDRRHAREPGHRRAVHVHRGHGGAARVRLRAARGRQGADPACARHPDRALRGRRGRRALPARVCGPCSRIRAT